MLGGCLSLNFAYFSHSLRSTMQPLESVTLLVFLRWVKGLEKESIHRVYLLIYIFTNGTEFLFIHATLTDELWAMLNTSTSWGVPQHSWSVQRTDVHLNKSITDVACTSLLHPAKAEAPQGIFETGCTAKCTSKAADSSIFFSENKPLGEIKM